MLLCQYYTTLSYTALDFYDNMCQACIGMKNGTLGATFLLALLAIVLLALAFFHEIGETLRRHKKQPRTPSTLRGAVTTPK
jgi:hypothetical protein